MPVIAVLCVIGSYALGFRIFNLYLMVPVGIVCYFLVEMGYPIAPLVIAVILGPMADENLRRALMVSQGSLLPIVTRPVSLILFIAIILTVLSQTKLFKQVIRHTVSSIRILLSRR
jgi:putative tricarboxylic transport membrane protein